MPGLRVLAKLTVFAVLTFVGQIVVCSLFPQLVLSSVLEPTVRACAHAEIVLVGDSAMAPRGPEFVSLSAMLQEVRPDDRVSGATLLGGDTRMKYHVLRSVLARGPKHKGVIVGLNLNLMFPDWNPFQDMSRRGARHLALCRLGLRCLTRPAAVFKFFEHISRVQENKVSPIPLEFHVKRVRELPPGTAGGDFSHLPPDALPEDAIYVQRMAKVLRDHEIPAVLYLSPLNIERGEWVYGGNQKEAAQKYAEIVQEAGAAGGVYVHNWLFEGDEDEFEPNEIVSVHMLSGLQRRIAVMANDRLSALIDDTDQGLQ